MSWHCSSCWERRNGTSLLGHILGYSFRCHADLGIITTDFALIAGVTGGRRGVRWFTGVIARVRKVVHFCRPSRDEMPRFRARSSVASVRGWIPSEAPNLIRKHITLHEDVQLR